jgi:3-hydroxyisobutyrate dehydrogenase-like beta-hydroxyacid dehydrogenase
MSTGARGGSGESSSYDVAVVGCGLMGAALARTLVKAGYSVVAWNRTHSRAEALAADGVVPERSLEAAFNSAPLVLACTLTPENTQEVLAPINDASGTTIAFVGSGSPESARELAQWTVARGGDYLDGVIVSYPEDIGTPQGVVVVAGDAALWSRHEPVFLELGGSSFHAGEDIGNANLLATAFSGAFIVASLASYAEGATFAHGLGLPLDGIQRMTRQGIALLATRCEEITDNIHRGHHATDQATIATFADGARKSMGVLAAYGYSNRLVAAAQENLAAAEAAGLSELAFSAQTEVLRPGG